MWPCGQRDGHREFVGARQYAGSSLIWGAINLIAGLLIWADLRYYSDLGGNLGIGLVALAVLLTLAWVLLQVVALPFLIESDPPRLRAAFKQAFVLLISQPLFIVSLLIVVTLLGVLCWYLPILLGYAFAYLALVANLAVLYVLDQRSGQPHASKKS